MVAVTGGHHALVIEHLPGELGHPQGPVLLAGCPGWREMTAATVVIVSGAVRGGGATSHRGWLQGEERPPATTHPGDPCIGPS